MFRYQTHAEDDSLYNTPPTFAIYLVRNVLEWIEKEGGLKALEASNRKKAELLYGALDRLAGFYLAPVETASRSRDEHRLPRVRRSLSTRSSSPRRRRPTWLVSRATARRVEFASRPTMPSLVRDFETLASFMQSFAQSNG